MKRHVDLKQLIEMNCVKLEFVMTDLKIMHIKFFLLMLSQSCLYGELACLLKTLLTRFAFVYRPVHLLAYVANAKSMFILIISNMR